MPLPFAIMSACHFEEGDSQEFRYTLFRRQRSAVAPEQTSLILRYDGMTLENILRRARFKSSIKPHHRPRARVIMDLGHTEAGLDMFVDLHTEVQSRSRLQVHDMGQHEGYSCILLYCHNPREADARAYIETMPDYGRNNVSWLPIEARATLVTGNSVCSFVQARNDEDRALQLSIFDHISERAGKLYPDPAPARLEEATP